MNDSEQRFFALVRFSLGLTDSFPASVGESEWEALYGMSVKQAVTGICFAGVSRLKRSGNVPDAVFLKWLGTAAMIQERNEALNRQCVAVQRALADAGFRSSILKGQGVAALYGERLASLRQPGDIDVYVDCGREKILAFARTRRKNVEWDYKHLHLDSAELIDRKIGGGRQNADVEIHYRAQTLPNPWKNRRLQKMFEAEGNEFFAGEAKLQSDSGDNPGCEVMVTPSAELNVLYILVHMYHHLFAEGLGLRQMMDFHFVLKAWNPTDGGVALRRRLKELGMSGFAGAVVWVDGELFSETSSGVLCEPDPENGRFILDEIVKGGNFGYRLTGSRISRLAQILKRNLHLLLHYPCDALASPLYYIWHFIWKRTRK